MNFRSKVFSSLSGWVYSLGALLGLVFFTLAVWGDFEAGLYDAVIQGDQRLETLECPKFIAPWETGTITASVSNPLGLDIDPRVRVHITAGFVTLMSEDMVTVNMAPGESKTLHWQVTADDAAFGGLLILTRVYVFRNHGLPSRDAFCGILVLDILGLSGQQIYDLSFAISIFLMLIGAGGWFVAHWPLKGRAQFLGSAMIALGLIVVVGLVATAEDWLVLGMLLVLIAVLLLASLALFLTPEP